MTNLREELNLIFESTPLYKASQLPEQIQKSLITKIYPKKYGPKRSILKRNKPYSITDISKINSSAYSMTNKKWSSLNIGIIKRLKLIGILSYGNGDYAWYSLVNGKVYDMNLDVDEFSGFLSKDNKKYQKDMWPPMPYSKWERSVLSGNHIDAWNNRKVKNANITR